MITSADISATLDATDELLHWFVADDARLNDDRLLAKLGELRQEHKKTLGVIESLYREKRMQEQQHHPHRCHGRKAKKTDALELMDEGSIEERALRDAYVQLISNQKSSKCKYVDAADLVADFDSDFYELDSLDSYLADFPEDDRVEMLRSARSLLFADETFELNSATETSSTRRIQALGSEWEPGITIPQPFNMTIRDETAPIRATYAERFVKNLLDRQAAIDKTAEDPNSRLFKARTPPMSTYLPLYEEMVQKHADRRQFVRQYSGEMLKEKQRPFKLSSTPIGSHARRCNSLENLNIKLSEFRAKPVPSRVLNTREINEMLLERDRKRKEIREQRAMQLLSASALPRNMQVHVDMQRMLNERRHKSRCFESHSFSPQIHDVPNFKALQAQFEQSLNAAKLQYNKTTIAKPFSLRTENINPCRHESHEMKRRHVARRRSRSMTNAAPPKAKMTTAAALRAEAIKRHLEESEERTIVRVHDQRELFLQEFREKVREKNRQQEEFQFETEKQRLKQLREADLSKQSDFVAQLKEMEERVNQRPSVLDRQEELIKKQSAAARIRAALRSAGFSEAYQEERVAQELELMDANEQRQLDEVPEEGSSGSARASTVSEVAEEMSLDSAKSISIDDDEIKEMTQNNNDSRKSSAVSIPGSQKSATPGGQSPQISSPHSSSSSTKGTRSKASKKSSVASSIKHESNGDNMDSDKYVSRTEISITEIKETTETVVSRQPKEKDFFD